MGFNKMELVPIANKDWCMCIVACIAMKYLQKTQLTEYFNI